MAFFKKKTLLIITLSVIATSCANNKSIESDNNCQDSKEGILVDMTGLDGCGWMIKLNDGKKLNPTNLKSFNLKLSNDKKVSFNYIEKHDMFGTCMAGKIVEIKCITEIIE